MKTVDLETSMTTSGDRVQVYQYNSEKEKKGILQNPIFSFGQKRRIFTKPNI